MGSSEDSTARATTGTGKQPEKPVGGLQGMHGRGGKYGRPGTELGWSR